MTFRISNDVPLRRMWRDQWQKTPPNPLVSVGSAASRRDRRYERACVRSTAILPVSRQDKFRPGALRLLPNPLERAFSVWRALAHATSPADLRGTRTQV